MQDGIPDSAFDADYVHLQGSIPGILPRKQRGAKKRDPLRGRVFVKDYTDDQAKKSR